MGKFAAGLKVSVLVLAVLFSLALLAVSLPFSGLKSMSVQTGSMKPAIDPGSLVFVKKVPASQLAVGDVITYINPANQQQTITHRIVQKLGEENSPKSFVVKGDANPIPDAPIPQNAVLGKVSYQVPFIGRAVDFIRQPLGLILIIYIPAMIVIINEIRRLSAHYKSLRPYIAAGYEPNQKKRSASQKALWGTKIVSFFVVLSMTLAIPAVRAGFKTSATLTGNTISMTVIPPPNQCLNNANNTNVNVTGNGGNNTNNVTVTNSSSQTATSGNATASGNTNGGSATSGNATNTNCTNVNININN